MPIGSIRGQENRCTICGCLHFKPIGVLNPNIIKRPPSPYVSEWFNFIANLLPAVHTIPNTIPLPLMNSYPYVKWHLLLVSSQLKLLTMSGIVALKRVSLQHPQALFFPAHCYWHFRLANSDWWSPRTPGDRWPGALALCTSPGKVWSGTESTCVFLSMPTTTTYQWHKPM